ncbi:MAG: alpha/beta hydrolase [Myxococcota bacterium]
MPFTPSVGLRLLRGLARLLLSEPLARGLAARETNLRGDVLDPQLALLLRLERRRAPYPPDLPIGDRRSNMQRSCFLVAADPVDVPTRDGVAAGLDVRWYEPSGATHALVFLHGGGWAVGDLDSHDGLCRRLAARSGCVVVAVDYPRSPEHPWPGPIHAVVDAWKALHAELSARFDHVALGGDSAGGHLTTCACRLLRDGGPLPSLQLLIYPGLDATLSGASHEEFAEGYLLTRQSIDYYLERFAPDPQHPLGSPGLAPDLEGLPPAVFAVAGFDPLRDEGLLYARRLGEAGVPVELLDFGDMVHGFANMDGLIRSAGVHVDHMADALAVAAGVG